MARKFTGSSPQQRKVQNGTPTTDSATSSSLRRPNRAPKDRAHGFATKTAKRTRRYSREASERGNEAGEVEENDSDGVMFSTPNERPNLGSMELGEPSPMHVEQETSTTTSASSVFDAPEDRSSSPDQTPKQGTKRKRPSQSPTPQVARSFKRSKAATPATSDENAQIRSPTKSSSKKTYASAKRTKLPSQESVQQRLQHDADSGLEDEYVDTPAGTGDLEENEDEDMLVDSDDFKCSVCGRILQTATGLKRHESLHKVEGSNTGHFTEREKHLLFRYRDNACDRWSLKVEEFNDLLNLSKGQKWHSPNISKEEVLAGYYEVLPNRDRRSMRRFKERWFKNTAVERHEKWSLQEDRDLTRLVRENGQKWVEIAGHLGRTQDEVSQRWFNKVQHQDKQHQGAWSEEEVQNLRNVVRECKQALGVGFGPGTDHEIRWSVVSDKLGNTRSRQQCSLRWKRLRRAEEQVGENQHRKRRIKENKRIKEFAARKSAGEELGTSDEAELLNASNPTPTRKGSRRRSASSQTLRKTPTTKRRKSSAGRDNLSGVSPAEDNEVGTDRDASEVQEQIDAQLRAVDRDALGIDEDVVEQPDAQKEDEESDEDNPLPDDLPMQSHSSQKQGISHNPFIGVNTPAKNLSQMFRATQANSSDVKINKSRQVVEETPIQPPERPSPKFAELPDIEIPSAEKAIGTISPSELLRGQDDASVASEETASGSDDDDASDSDDGEIPYRAPSKNLEESDEEFDAEVDDEPPQTFSSSAFRHDSSDEEEEEDDDDDEEREISRLVENAGEPEDDNSQVDEQVDEGQARLVRDSADFDIYEDESIVEVSGDEEQGDFKPVAKQELVQDDEISISASDEEDVKPESQEENSSTSSASAGDFEDMGDDKSFLEKQHEDHAAGLDSHYGDGPVKEASLAAVVGSIRAGLSQSRSQSAVNGPTDSLSQPVTEPTSSSGSDVDSETSSSAEEADSTEEEEEEDGDEGDELGKSSRAQGSTQRSWLQNMGDFAKELSSRQRPRSSRTSSFL